MGIETKIQWTHHTFNPWIGCTKVHAGCTNCYAEADMDKRRGRVKWGPGGTRSRTTDAYWREPLKWDRDAAAAGERHRVFCASLADVFEDWQGPIIDSKGERLYSDYMHNSPSADPIGLTMADMRQELFELIDKTPNLDWLLLTKRPENILRFICPNDAPDQPDNNVFMYHRKNVWLGTSVSDQTTANKMIPELLKCRDLSPVLFLSAEPLLGPIDLTKVGNHDCTAANLFDGNCLFVGDIGGAEYAWSPRNFIRWVIIGGESGPNARRCNPQWVRHLVEQCKSADVPTFVKQLGSNIVTRNDMVEDEFNNLDTGFPDPAVEYDINGYRENYQGADCRIHLQDKKGGDPNEWPADLRVREFPCVTAAG